MKWLKDNWVALTIGVAIIVVISMSAGLFSILVSGEKSYYVGDMISGTLGFTGSAAGPSDSNGKYSIEIKQIDGTWREAWSDEYTRDLRITFTKSYPSICNDVYKNYGENIACDSPGKWGFRPKISVGNSRYECPLQNYVEPGCFSYIPRLRQAYAYYGRYAEGIMVKFTANDVQEDGNIIYKTVVTAETSGGSFGVGVSEAWDLVPNPNPKECSNNEYDADLENNKYRQCDADGYWMDYVTCSSTQKLEFKDGSFACVLIPVDDVPVDNTIPDTTSNTPSASLWDSAKEFVDFQNHTLKASVTTGILLLVIGLLIAFLPGGKKK